MAGLGGIVYQEICEARDLARFPPPGKLVEVDGRLMHIHCRGQGSPTVVLEQGLNGVSAAWDTIHSQMAASTRVCAYDRAGLGYSEPLAHPTRAPEVAERLLKLLRNARIEDDLVLVGWSAGGIYVRELYRQQPEKVKAMLLLDSSHEEQTKRLPPAPVINDNSVLKVARYLAPLGLLRLSGMVEQRFRDFRGTDELRARLIALYQQSHVVGAMLRESDAFNFDIDGALPPSLADLPLIVVAPGEPTDASGATSAAEAAYLKRARAVAYELQRELAALSTRGRLVIATGSGHAIHADQPELVLEALEQLVELVRAQS